MTLVANVNTDLQSDLDGYAATGPSAALMCHEEKNAVGLAHQWPMGCTFTFDLHISIAVRVNYTQITDNCCTLMQICGNYIRNKT